MMYDNLIYTFLWKLNWLKFCTIEISQQIPGVSSRRYEKQKSWLQLKYTLSSEMFRTVVKAIWLPY